MLRWCGCWCVLVLAEEVYAVLAEELLDIAEVAMAVLAGAVGVYSEWRWVLGVYCISGRGLARTILAAANEERGDGCVY